MTPYAVLGLKPSEATDEAVRKRFHVLSRQHHPDRPGANGEPGDLWHAVTQAYAAVKTQALRDFWERANLYLAGVCRNCDGCGLEGRVGKARLCEACGGEGRVRSRRKAKLPSL